MASASTADNPGSLLGCHQCRECHFVGKTATALRIHVTRTHTEKEKKPFGCDFPGCDYRTTDKAILPQHIRRCHTKNKEQLKVHACSLCDFRALTKGALRRHAISHSNERPFLCDFPSCSFQTKGQRHLDRHKMIHDPNQEHFKVHSCKICDFRCRVKSYLVIHMRTHTGEKPYVCGFPGCTFRTRKKGNLNTHRRTHDPDSMLKCDYPGCEYRGATRSRLECHQELHNPERKREFKCPLCSKKFAMKGSWSGHIKAVHTREKRIACKFCDLDFSSDDAVRMHTIKAHAARVTGMETIVKVHKCTVCDYCSPYKPSVVTHQRRTHSSVARKFECNNCGYRGKFRVDLSKHLSRCSGQPRVRSFECQLCPKKFFTGDVLTQHMRTVHRPDKRYKCPQCEFATNYNENLQGHLKSLHQEQSGAHQAPDLPINKAYGRPLRKRNRLSVDDGAAVAKAELKYKCQFPGCNYGTAYYSGIKVHERRHRPEMQNIPCSMCPKKFFTHSDLKVHISCSHAKEKPFKCELCDHSSSVASNLRKHKRHVHSGKPVRPFKTRKNDPAKLVPPEHLGVISAYACPFCDWTHDEYMSVVRHTVTHRSVSVSLEKCHLVYN